MNMKDKIIFWMGGDFTHFSLSYYLQKMYDCELYGIVDITNKTKNFFQKQDLVSFNKTWFFHDHININKKPDLEYLKYIENKYDLNLCSIISGLLMLEKCHPPSLIILISIYFLSEKKVSIR